MAKFVSETGLSYFYNRIKALFASKTELTALDTKVDDLIAEGGEPNTIETVSVNGAKVAPDAQKNVALTVPTKTSDITNDGDGTSNFATEDYVDQNGGKIDKIKVNDVEQAISGKAVNIIVPTKVSELTNDSSFQTADEVEAAISEAVTRLFNYKGSVATVEDLPATGNTEGDVYDVRSSGMNYVWTGTAWDAFGQLVDTSLLWAKSELVAMTTAEIDAVLNHSA